MTIIKEKNNKWVSAMEEPLRLIVEGVVPGATYTLILDRSSITKAHLIERKSSASYVADEAGVIDLTYAEPIDGTYSGFEPMGLFWSMEVIEKSENVGEVYERLAPHQFTLTVWQGENQIASEQLIKTWYAEEIDVVPVQESELIGNYYVHKDGLLRPVVIVVSGSEGGINDFYASILSRYGFNTFAVAYFGIEGLSKTLTEIPLEIIGHAIEWLEGREDAEPGWLGIHGVSRGGELALWSAVLFDEIKTAVSLNGSAISFAGIVPWTDASTLPPAWTYKGEALPYALPDNPVETALYCKSLYQKDENALLHWYDTLFESGVDKAIIPI